MQLRKKLSNDGWIEINEGIKLKIDYPTLEQHEELENIVMSGMDKEQTQAMYQFFKKLIKYCVKDWQGFDEKCEIVNNELSDELYQLITYSVNQVMLLGNLINKEIEFLDADKKK